MMCFVLHIMTTRPRVMSSGFSGGMGSRGGVGGTVERTSCSEMNPDTAGLLMRLSTLW